MARRGFTRPDHINRLPQTTDMRSNMEYSAKDYERKQIEDQLTNLSQERDKVRIY